MPLYLFHKTIFLQLLIRRIYLMLKNYFCCHSSFFRLVKIIFFILRKNLISNNMRLIQFLVILKIFGEYTVIAQTESPNPEEGLFDIDRAKKVSATEKLA